MSTWRRRLVTAAWALLLALVVYELWYWTHGLKPGAETYYFKQGTTLRGVAEELKRRGALVETRSFVWVPRSRGRAASSRPANTASPTASARARC